MNGLRFIDERLFDKSDGLAGEFLKAALHAADGPKKIYGGRAGFTYNAADLAEAVAEFRNAGAGEIARSQGNAHGRGDADGRSSTHDHGANGIGYSVVVGAVNPDLFGRQLGLVNKQNARISPLQGLKHKVLSIRLN